MRGAILLYGITRGNGAIVQSSLNNTIYKKLEDARHTIDIYQHAWVVNTIQNPRSKVGEHDHIVKNPDDWDAFRVTNRLIYDQSKFDQMIDWSTILKDCKLHFNEGHSIDNLKNFYRQMVSLNCVYNMIKDFTHFDYYMLLRQDLLYTYTHDDGILKCIDELQNIKAPVINTPNWANSVGVNDRIAICNKSGVKIYCNRWKHIKHANKMSSEEFLQFVIKKTCTINRNFRQVGRRLRANGQIELFDRGETPL